MSNPEDHEPAEAEQEYEPDPPEFDRSKVPAEHADLFFSGRSGRGLTNEEYDETKRRYRKHGAWPFDDNESEATDAES